MINEIPPPTGVGGGTPKLRVTLSGGRENERERGREKEKEREKREREKETDIDRKTERQ